MKKLLLITIFLFFNSSLCLADLKQNRVPVKTGFTGDDDIEHTGAGCPEKFVAALQGSHYKDTQTGTVWTKYLGTGKTGWFSSHADYLAHWWCPDTSIYVSVGGFPESRWNGNESMHGNTTCIDPYLKSRSRQDGYLRQLRWKTFKAPLAGKPYKIKVLRPKGGENCPDYDFVGETNEVYHNNDEVQMCILKKPIPWKIGDTFGIYGAEHSRPCFSKIHGMLIGFAEGDVSSKAVFATELHKVYNMEPYDYPPSAVMTGDSLTSNGYSGYFISDGPSNDAAKIIYQPLYQLQQIINPGNFTYQNLGSSGNLYAWTLSQGVPKALASMTKNLIIKGGNNDLLYSDWSAVEKALNAIKMLCEANAVVPELYICSISPSSTHSDERAAKARLWNGYTKVWCAKNNATFIDIYNQMGKLRKSTGFYDDLANAYDRGDHVHYTPAGATAFAAIIKETIESKNHTFPPSK